MQAKLFEHSVFDTHSGRHRGGEPIISWAHEHEGWPPTSLQIELGPQGEGEHGLTGVVGMSDNSRSQFVNGFPV